MLVTYKRQDNQKLWIYGHFTDEEKKELKREGYKFSKPQYNKHGIRVMT